MKYYALVLASVVSFTMMGQSQLNSSFENWGYDSYGLPFCHNWAWGVVNTPCGPYSAVTEKTNDSFHGSWAVKMESKVCSSPSGGPRLRTGRIQTAITGDTIVTHPLGWSLGYSERPEELSFYYKFHQEGTDSAAIYLLLFNYDVDTYNVDTVGIASSYIHEETTEYTEFTLPIEYYKNDTPSFIHILFITSKTLADLGDWEYEPAYELAQPGTTFWVDNIVLRGGTVNTTSPQEEVWNFSVYPNPTEEEIYLDIPQQVQVDKVQVYDNQGRVVKEFMDFDNTLNISDIPKGIYYLKLETNKGTRFRKVIKK